MRTGIANFGLDWGRCPAWLFQRMVRLARVCSIAIINKFGTTEFLKRLSDPVWFQSFGTVLAFDWNASGLTTTTLGALKEALRGMETSLGFFVCGGKGSTSRKTPQEIQRWGEILNLSQEQVNFLVYASRASAKVDSSLVQDGFQIYHHNFIFNQEGFWTVIQQGMNTNILKARRYHWWGGQKKRFIEEPHAGIASQIKEERVLDLTARKSRKNRKITLELTHSAKTLYHDLKILKDNQENQFKVLTLAKTEFSHHPVEEVNFSHPLIQKNIQKLIARPATTFERMLMRPGVGGKTIRALSLVAEIIYGAQPSYQDPARFSFAYGGKDGTPYPVDRRTYDKTLFILENALRRARLGLKEKDEALRRVEQVIRQAESPF